MLPDLSRISHHTLNVSLHYLVKCECSNCVTDDDMGESKLRWTDLILVDIRVKINGIWYYCDVLLTVKLPPVIHEISVEFVVIKQKQSTSTQSMWDSQSVSLLEWETSAVVTSRHDPNSRDLTDKNSRRTTVASHLTEMNDVDERKQCPVNVWNGLRQSVISGEWCERHQCEHVCAKEDVTHANVANLWSWKQTVVAC